MDPKEKSVLGKSNGVPALAVPHGKGKPGKPSRQRTPELMAIVGKMIINIHEPSNLGVAYFQTKPCKRTKCSAKWNEIHGMVLLVASKKP
jgi:hypothetical protein